MLEGGYTGKILRVNLSDQSYSIEDTSVQNGA